MARRLIVGIQLLGSNMNICVTVQYELININMKYQLFIQSTGNIEGPYEFTK